MKGSGVGNRYYTFLAIPQGKGSIKKVKISSAFLSFISIAIITVLLSLCCLSYNYMDTRGKIKELARLEQVTSLQQEKIDFLANKVDDFEKEMINLAQLDKKIRIMTNLDNNDKNNNQLLGVGGPVPEDDKIVSHAEEVEASIIDKIHDNMDKLLEGAAIQKDSFTELLDFLGKQKSILACTPSIWPTIGWVTSEFGYRTSPFTGNREFHRGIDIATELGKEVVAPADGVVKEASYEKGMGNMVRIDHGNSLVTVYGHLLKKGDARTGQRVKRGDVIGYVGNSGRSTGPHLHYGICINGIYVNPRKHLF